MLLLFSCILKWDLVELFDFWFMVIVIVKMWLGMGSGPGLFWIIPYSMPGSIGYDNYILIVKSFTFHLLLQSLELWNMTENMTMTVSAHEGLIAALAVSTVMGLVASASHDKFVKLWKWLDCVSLSNYTCNTGLVFVHFWSLDLLTWRSILPQKLTL